MNKIQYNSYIVTTEVLRILIRKSDYTYNQVGEYLQCSNSYVSRMLSGKRKLSLERFLDLLFLLDLDLKTFQHYCFIISNEIDKDKTL